MGSLIVDGVNLATYGVVATSNGIYATPQIDYGLSSVNGRNGDVIIDRRRFTNVEIVYPCYISKNFNTNYNNLIAFLMSRKGYVKIQNSYDSGHYRMGFLSNSVTPEMRTLNRNGDFELVFNCKPQRFLTSGDQVTSFTSSGTITNPTAYEANPIYCATLKGATTTGYNLFSVNGIWFKTYQSAGSTYIRNYSKIYFDADTWNVYGENASGQTVITANCNPDIVAGYNLTAGSNAISINTTYVSKLEITPRWWAI